MKDGKYEVNSYHTQSISKISDDFEVIAVDELDNIEAFKHKTKQIYGVVWHPERMTIPVLPASIKTLLFN
jgi:gamma-glutamyl-gamma-aminobutyrate hydrolase PuuD